MGQEPRQCPPGASGELLGLSLLERPVAVPGHSENEGRETGTRWPVLSPSRPCYGRQFPGPGLSTLLAPWHPHRRTGPLKLSPWPILEPERRLGLSREWTWRDRRAGPATGWQGGRGATEPTANRRRRRGRLGRPAGLRQALPCSRPCWTPGWETRLCLGDSDLVWRHADRRRSHTHCPAPAPAPPQLQTLGKSCPRPSVRAP